MIALALSFWFVDQPGFEYQADRVLVLDLRENGRQLTVIVLNRDAEVVHKIVFHFGRHIVTCICTHRVQDQSPRLIRREHRLAKKWPASNIFTLNECLAPGCGRLEEIQVTVQAGARSGYSTWIGARNRTSYIASGFQS